MILQLIKNMYTRKKQDRYLNALVQAGVLVRWHRKGADIFIQPYYPAEDIKLDFTVLQKESIK